MDFLMKTINGISRNSAKSLLTNRQVYIDNIVTTQYNFLLKPGMKVQVSKEKGKKEFKSNLLKIVYEDAYLIVIDKKEGLPTVGTGKLKKERTAHSILNDYVQRSGKQHKVYTIHRLDKEASGLMIFAKDEKTKINLQDHWHEIVKEYRFVAVLSGEMEKDNGAITSWMVDNKLYITHSGLSNNSGDKAITYYKTIKRSNGYSLVELETERKNQIRVHMNELGHPVSGDIKYTEEDSSIDRLALHAFKISFNHPVTGELMNFETPYPSLFKKVMIKQTSSPHNN